MDGTSSETQSGIVIVLSGISGSGKSYIADTLVKKYNFKLLDKYVTRPFRKQEIKDQLAGKHTGVIPVYGNYNNGEQSKLAQQIFDKARKDKFRRLNLPISYFSTYLQH